MHYVYLLESGSEPDRRYLVLVSILDSVYRIITQASLRTRPSYRPWRIVTYVAFSNRSKAEAFERYLKSGSGHAFARKRLW